MNLRRLPLEGLYNIRELGGFPVPGGGTRWNRFLRADLISGLTGEVMEQLVSYGVTDVFDLRDKSELKTLPNSFIGHDSIAVHNFPLIPLDMASIESVSYSYKDMTLPDMYELILKNARHYIGEIFTGLSRAEGVSLIHCSAGKDRTGIIVMLLLALVGVSDADIISDYQVSFTYMQPRIKEWRLDASPERERFFLSNAEFMEQALDTVNTRYGGPSEYLHGAGLSREDEARLIEAFVERA